MEPSNVDIREGIELVQRMSAPTARALTYELLATRAARINDKELARGLMASALRELQLIESSDHYKLKVKQNHQSFYAGALVDIENGGWGPTARMLEEVAEFAAEQSTPPGQWLRVQLA